MNLKIFTCLLTIQTGWGFPPPKSWSSSSSVKPSLVTGRDERDPRLTDSWSLDRSPTRSALVSSVCTEKGSAVCVCGVSMYAGSTLSPGAVGLWVWAPLCAWTDPAVTLTRWMNSWVRQRCFLLHAAGFQTDVVGDPGGFRKLCARTTLACSCKVTSWAECYTVSLKSWPKETTMKRTCFCCPETSSWRMCVSHSVVSDPLQPHRL